MLLGALGRTRTMRVRALLIALGLAAVTSVWAVQADEPVNGGQGAVKKQQDLTLREQQLEAQYKDFELAMVKLMQRLRASTNKEDKLRAEVLERAIDQAQKGAITVRFEQLVDALRKQKG